MNMKTAYIVFFLFIRVMASAQTNSNERPDSNALFNSPELIHSLNTLVHSANDIVFLLNQENGSLMQKFIAMLENETSFTAIGRFCLRYDLDSVQLLQSIRFQLSAVEQVCLSIQESQEQATTEAISHKPGIDSNLSTRYFARPRTITGFSNTELSAYIITAFHSIHELRLPGYCPAAFLSADRKAGCQWIMAFSFIKCF